MGTAGATSGGRQRRRLRQLTAIGLSISLSGLSPIPVMNRHAAAAGDTRTLSMYFGHTKESITVTFKKEGRYVPDGLAKINHFLRDWRADKETRMDPELIDLVWELHQELGSEKPVHIISAFRASETNAMLKRIGRNVARRSQHIQGKAMDVYFPDVPLKRLRENALLREAGGVGYYPRSGRNGFVHIDTGRVRHWPRMSEQQLAALFRNKKRLTTPKQKSPLMIARAERASVPVPRLNPVRATKPAAILQVASADDTARNVPVPRSKPFYLAQNVVAIPVSAPSRRDNEPSLIEPETTKSMAFARVDDSLVLPPPLPQPVTTSEIPELRDGLAIVGDFNTLLDTPAQTPRMAVGLDEPARPTVSVKSLKARSAPTVVASVSPTAPIVTEPRPEPAAPVRGERGDKRTIFPLRLLRHASEEGRPKLASLSPEAMHGDSSDLTASIDKSVTPTGLLAIQRANKGDLLGGAQAVKFAVIELSGNRHMIINRTNKGDFLGMRRADVSGRLPKLASASAELLPVAEELAGGPETNQPDVGNPARSAGLARPPIPRPRIVPRRATEDSPTLLTSIRRLFQ